MTPHWNLDDNCPPAIANIADEETRERAIALANEALDAGRHPIRALSEGVARALAASDPATTSAPGAAWFVGLDHAGTYVVFREDTPDDALRFDRYEDAVRRGCELARGADTALYVSLDGDGLMGKWEFFTASPRASAVHVMPSGDDWVLRTLDHPDLGRFRTKKAAKRAAEEIAREGQLNVVTHYRRGEVQRVTHYEDERAVA